MSKAFFSSFLALAVCAVTIAQETAPADDAGVTAEDLKRRIAAIEQETAPAGNPFAEERERRRALEQIFEGRDIEGQMSEAAFECAALAFRFDQEEHERLLRLGYTQGHALMAALVTTAFEIDVESVQWAETPFRDLRELIAFQLGQLYGKIEDKFFREIPYGDSGESWKASYKREYDARNCALIGR